MPDRGLLPWCVRDVTACSCHHIARGSKGPQWQGVSLQGSAGRLSRPITAVKRNPSVAPNINTDVSRAVFPRHAFSLTAHFISYIKIVSSSTPFCSQKSVKSSCHGFNKVLKTFLRHFGPCRHGSSMQLLHICRLYLHDVNVPLHYIP